MARKDSREKCQRSYIKKMAESLRRSKRNISREKNGFKTHRPSRSRSRSQNRIKKVVKPLSHRDRIERSEGQYLSETKKIEDEGVLNLQ